MDILKKASRFAGMKIYKMNHLEVQENTVYANNGKTIYAKDGVLMENGFYDSNDFHKIEDTGKIPVNAFLNHLGEKITEYQFHYKDLMNKINVNSLKIDLDGYSFDTEKVINIIKSIHPNMYEIYYNQQKSIHTIKFMNTKKQEYFWLVGCYK